MNGMRSVLQRVQRSSRVAEPVTIYYAFKQAKSGDEGVASAGWSSFLQAVVDAGFIVDGTWPIRTELTGNLKGKMNALASSVVLVCRKHPDNALVVTRAEFIRALKLELPDAIDNIRKAGVGPVDMQQSVIGPGMGVFTRYKKVLEDDDGTMSVKTALSLINRVWEEIENELDGNFDAATQVARAWFSTYGFEACPSLPKWGAITEPEMAAWQEFLLETGAVRERRDPSVSYSDALIEDFNAFDPGSVVARASA
jgi:putative DNA methylase